MVDECSLPVVTLPLYFSSGGAADAVHPAVITAVYKAVSLDSTTRLWQCSLQIYEPTVMFSTQQNKGCKKQGRSNKQTLLSTPN